MRIPALTVTLALLLLPTHARSTDNTQQRRSAARQMTEEFAHLDLHKIYVPDFCDSSSRPNDQGAYFAATFSKMLTRRAQEYTVVSRMDAHRFLLQNHWTDCDLARPEILAKFSVEFAVDEVLWGNLSSTNDSVSIDFVLRDLSGKELLRSHYSEPRETNTEAYFPAPASPSGWPFYFPLLDGVTAPRALKMENPSYTDSARRSHISGEVILSAVVTIEGKIDQVRIIQELDPSLAKACVNQVKKWELEPAKGPDGIPVPVRSGFAVSFKLN